MTTTAWAPSVGPQRGQDDAFARLHPRVQHLVRHELGWRRLRDVQVDTVRPVMDGDHDVLLLAGTAAGKTEAAWFPVLSRVLAEGAPTTSVLCLTPLKALIDDQVRRLSGYGQSLGIRVEGWHGDVAHSRKMRLLEVPAHALVITPESLEGLLLRRPDAALRMLAPLRYVVVDEVHAFVGTDRGHQLQSLLHRLEHGLGRAVPRIALSATVSDPDLVAEYLRPGHGAATAVVSAAPTAGSDIDVQAFGVEGEPRRTWRRGGQPGEAASVRDAATADRLTIARRLDRLTRGHRCLVFAGSRLAVEEMTALLKDPKVTGTGRPQRFVAHHGSLSPQLRRAAEAQIGQGSDTTIVCTTTLELGVDLPRIEQVVQLGPCLTVAGLRQRLGRSGRQEGHRPVLRLYATELPQHLATSIDDRLRADLFQAVAAVEIVRTGAWVEPSDVASLGLSTLVHQTLAMLADPRGTTAQHAWERLCHTGPWRRVPTGDFADLLRELAGHGLIRQDERGLLLLDEAGQRLVGRRDFLTVFVTPVEYSLRHDGKDLGTLPVSYPLTVGSYVVLGGRAWQVVAARGAGWVLDVIPDDRGLPPRFGGGRGTVHRHVRDTMRSLYRADTVPDYLDETARRFLAEGRAAFAELGLATRTLVPVGTRTLLAPWTGDRELSTLRRMIETKHPGVRIDQSDIGLLLDLPEPEARTLLRILDGAPAPTPVELTDGVVGLATGKFDSYLPDRLLRQDYASRRFDIPAALNALRRALERAEGPRPAAAGTASA